jgi:predicted  nucleic acid-binding Zn-ribbon protein
MNMELDELEKRLEWLDSERQKSNSQILEFKDKIAGLETVVEKQRDRITVLENELKNYVPVPNRISQLDESTAQQKIDLLKQISDLEKKLTSQMKVFEKQQKEDVNVYNKRIAELQIIPTALNEVKKSVQARVDDVNRVAQRLDILEKETYKKKDNELQFTQSQKRLSDDLQIEMKRVTDLQIETSALRKRIEEERNRGDLNAESLRKLEIRTGKLEGLDIELKQAQTAFIDKISLSNLEQEKIWKAWQSNIDEVTLVKNSINTKLLELEAMHSSIEKSKNELDDINLRFDRRINELTEMHRLTEERFRQEWVSFKTDDQKRWTSYLLTQEEQQQESERQRSTLLERVTTTEDKILELKDSLDLITEEVEKQVRSYLSVLHDVVESFEQTFAKK